MKKIFYILAVVLLFKPVLTQAQPVPRKEIFDLENKLTKAWAWFYEPKTSGYDLKEGLGYQHLGTRELTEVFIDTINQNYIAVEHPQKKLAEENYKIIIYGETYAFIFIQNKSDSILECICYKRQSQEIAMLEDFEKYMKTNPPNGMSGRIFNQKVEEISCENDSTQKALQDILTYWNKILDESFIKNK
jgi:hypothetical protein